MASSVPLAGPSARPGTRATLGLLSTLLVLAASATAAALRTSATFDEIVLVSAGARAVETGSWTLVVDQPPVMPLLYGLAARSVRPSYPAESRAGGWTYDDRWEYARDFFFRVGNDPRALAFAARLVAIVAALALAVAAFLYGLWIEGRRTALLAAFLVALLPDVVAHGAVAYNDVPLALAYLLAVWAIDVAVRRPSVTSAAVAGTAAALALGVKFSALALAPVVAVLIVLEAVSRPGGRAARWLGRVALAVGVGGAAAYVVLVALYRGDVFLIGLEYGLRFTVRHASEGHPAPAWLLGETSPDGWWYFFPVAFLVKTSVALHLLIPLALVGLWRGGPGRVRKEAEGSGTRSSSASSRLRGPLVGAAVFAAFLVRSDLNAGFRYALPALPPLLIVVACGVSRLWGALERRRRVAVLLLLLLYGGSTLTAFPWFLSYRSEWVRARSSEAPALLDSSMDWGQGLLALRDWMEEEDVPAVRLGYFGSALPGGYGIAHEPMPSFLPLPPVEGTAASVGSAARPGWTAISLTLLHGLYVPGDPYASYREREPELVVGGSLNLYRESVDRPPERAPDG